MYLLALFHLSPRSPCAAALLRVAEKACTWPVVHKALTTFGSGPTEELRIHHAHPHDPALLRAPSQLSLFEPDPLRSSMASLAAHSVRSVASTRVSANGTPLPMPGLSASSAGPTVYGTADSPGPWTREEGSRAGSAPLALIEPEAYQQLQLGTVALLEGRPSVALGHFVQAHVFGFLPCLLVSPGLRCRWLKDAAKHCAMVISREGCSGLVRQQGARSLEAATLHSMHSQ